MNKWVIRVLIGVIIGYVIARGGFAALGPLIRVGLMLAIFYFIYKLIRGITVISNHVKSAFPKDHPSHPRRDEQDETTIEICPKCGYEKKKNHRCPE